MPLPKNLAKFLADSKVKFPVYRGDLKEIKEFKPGAFFGHKEVANQFADPEYLYGTTKLAADESPHVTPAYLNLVNPKILTKQKEYEKYVMEGALNPEYWKKKGYDSLIYAPKGDFLDPNTYFVSFEPTQIKSAIGNRGTFDPLNPDITKKEGGKINPLKSPREMLFEMAGIPAMAKGGKLGIGAEMYKLVTDAIERYTKTYGKPPSPEDVKALKAHVEQISKKPEIKTDPATQARARHEMATDYSLINPEGPDPFLTKATTGRTPKGTYLKPKVQDIQDPNVMANIEAKQAAGELDEILPESITPSADYLGRMGTSLENEALAAGKVPLIDKLKQAFFAKHKRFPSDEELEVIIAEYNPLRHQYGEKGASIVTERPPTAKGMAEWKQRARTEGIPEAYLEKSPADYPQYLRDALSLGQGIQPGTKPLPATRINPDKSFAAGGATAPTTREMMAEMAVRSPKPSFMKRLGKRAMQGLNVAAVPLGIYETAEGSKELGRRLASGDYRGAVNKAISTTGSAIGSIPYAGLVPSLGLWALGEGLDYMTAEPEYEPSGMTSLSKAMYNEDPRNKQLVPPTTFVDNYLANKWIDDSGILNKR